MTTPNPRKKPFYANSTIEVLVAIGVAIALGKRAGWRGAEKQTCRERNMKFAWAEFHPETLVSSGAGEKKRKE